MKIIRTLKITPDEFYDYLEREILETANQNCTGKAAYTPADITAGFCTTKGGEESPSKIELTITSYERGSHYKAKATSFSDTYEFSYQTKTVDGGLEVTYEQELLNILSQKKKKNRLLAGFSEAVYLSRMSNHLYDLQEKILKERQGKDSHH